MSESDKFLPFVTELPVTQATSLGENKITSITHIPLETIRQNIAKVIEGLSDVLEDDKSLPYYVDEINLTVTVSAKGDVSIGMRRIDTSSEFPFEPRFNHYIRRASGDGQKTREKWDEWELFRGVGRRAHANQFARCRGGKYDSGP